MYLGGNDIRINWDIRETFEVYKSFCRQLKLRLPSVNLICSTIEPRFALPSDRHRTPPPEQYAVAAKAFNRLLKKWHFPNYRFLTWGANRLENTELFANDLIHLNQSGLKVLWDLIYDLIVKVVNDFTKEAGV